MLKCLITAVVAALAVSALAEEHPQPPQGPAPRFVTIARVDWDQGELIVSEECLPHPDVVSRTILKKEANRRDEPPQIGSNRVLQIHYYTTTHKLPLDRTVLYDARGKTLPEKAWSGLKPGTMELMSADGHPVEPEYLALVRPQTPILVVAVELLPSPYESPESTDAIEKRLRP